MKKKASENGQDDGGQANVPTVNSVRDQLEGEPPLETATDALCADFPQWFSCKTSLSPPVFREQEEGKPAAAGENAGNQETSNTEAASLGNVHEKNTSKDGGGGGHNNWETPRLQVKDEKPSVEGRNYKTDCPVNLETEQQRRMVTEQVQYILYDANMISVHFVSQCGSRDGNHGPWAHYGGSDWNISIIIGWIGRVDRHSCSSQNEL